jgi:hypothetical protein
MSSIYYEEELKELNKSGLKYLIVGGIAVNLHGLPRLTRDLDLMIDINADNLQKFVKVMKKLNYATKFPINEWQGKSAIAFFSDQDDSKQIDVLLKNPIDFKAAYKRRKMFKINEASFNCVGFDDLLKMKEIAGRDRDLIDMGYLKKFKSEEKT